MTPPVALDKTDSKRHSPLLQSKMTRFALCLVGNTQDVAHANRQLCCEIPFVSDSVISQVSCGLDWILFLLANGQAFSLGNNTYGQLGQGHLEMQPWPKPLSVPSTMRIVRIACGSSHGGLITDQGSLFMFGCGSYGRLGTGKEESSSVPVPVIIWWSAFAHEMSAKGSLTSDVHAHPSSLSCSTTLDGDAENRRDRVVFADVACGDRHTVVLSKHESSRSVVFSFGDGMNGRLGTGDEKDQLSPALVKFYRTDSHHHATMQVPMFPPIVSLSAGSSHNTALASSGELYTWGNGTEGQLGHGRFESEWTPHRVEFFRENPVVQASCGDDHTLAIVRGGSVYAWGRGNEGQLGTGSLISSSLPSRVVIADTGTTVIPTANRANDQSVVVRSIMAHDHTTMAIDDKQQLFVWGDNSCQQLGLPGREGGEVNGPVTVISKPKQFVYSDLFESKKRLSTSATSPASRRSVQTKTDEDLQGEQDTEESEGFEEDNHVSIRGRNARQLMWAGGSDRFSLLVFKMRSLTLNVMTRAMSLQPASASSFFSHPKSPVTPATCSPRETLRKQLFMSNTSFNRFMDQVPQTQSSKWNLMLLEQFKPDQMPSKQSLYFSFMSNYHVYFRPPEAHQQPSDPLLRGRSVYLGGGEELVDNTMTIRPKDSEPSNLAAPGPSTTHEDRSEHESPNSSVICLASAVRDAHNKTNGDIKASPPKARLYQIKGMTDWFNRHTYKLKKRRKMGCRFGRAKRFADKPPSRVTLTTLPTLGVPETAKTIDFKTVVASESTQPRPRRPTGQSSSCAFGRTLHCKASVIQRDVLHTIQTGQAQRPATVPTPSVMASEDPNKVSRRRLYTEQARQQQLRASLDMHTIRYRSTMQDLNAHIPAPFHHKQVRKARSHRRIQVAFGTCIEEKSDDDADDNYADEQSNTLRKQKPLCPERSVLLVFPTSPSVKIRDPEDFSLAIAKRLEHAKGHGPGPGAYF